jgi:hypothetical protein
MTTAASKTKPRKSRTTAKAGKTIQAKSKTAAATGKTIRAKSTTAPVNDDKPKSANAIGSWTVKGVEKETIVAAKKAAKRDGVFLGAWVNRVLRDAATDRLKDAPPPAVPQEDVMTAIATLTEKVDAMSDRRGFFARLFG